MIESCTGARHRFLVAVFAGAVLFAGVLLDRAGAQITIEATDLQALNGERVAIQQIYAENPANLQPLLSRTGANQDFDFTGYDYAVRFSGTRTQWTMSNAPADVPCRDRFESRGANVVTRFRFEGQGASADTTYWSYHNLVSDREEYFGACSALFEDVDGDGEQPDTLGVEWTPAQLYRQLPLNNQDAWSQQANHNPIPNTASLTTESDREWEVDAYGTLRTPVGAAAALRVHMQTVETTMNPLGDITNRLSSLEFRTKDRRISATIEMEGDPASITDAFFTVQANAGQSFEVASGTTPALSGPGASVTFAQPSTTAGTLNVSRFDVRPINNSFSGSATSDDGTSITPDVLWDDHYVTVHDWGLDGFTADVCMDLGSVSGIQNPDKLVLLTRESAAGAWTPLNSTLSGNQLCGTVSSFSQFAVGSNSADNPLPVELTLFEATRTGEQGVNLTWRTGSETNNAGFRIERRIEVRTGRESVWTEVGFVEGAGTTTDGQDYRFTDSDLPYIADSIAYRLRQVDIDGSTQVTDPVVVGRAGPQQLSLKKTTPNPARRQVTVRYAVPEDAQEARMRLYDVLGRQVRALDVGAKEGRHEQQIQVQGLASGVYLLRLTAGEQSQTRRFTIAR